MSAIRRETEEHGGGELEEAGRRGRAHAGPYRLVVVASPQSAAWQAATASRAGVLLLNPMRVSDAELLDPLQPSGEGEFGIPRWAVYDCAEVPGAVIGILRTPINTPRDQPLDPLAFVLATPHAEAGAWHLYSLIVCVSDVPEVETRLRMIGVAMGLLRAEWVSLIVPRSSPLLDRLTSLGEVEVLADHAILHGPEPAVTVRITPPPPAEPAP